MNGDSMQITKEMLKKIDGILSDVAETNEWLEFLRKKDPLFYQWMEESTGGAISRLGKISNLRLRQANGISRTMMCAFLSGYLIHHLQKNDEIISLLSPEDEYKAWREGMLPGKYYDYSLDGLDENDDRRIEREAYEKNVKEAKDREKRAKASLKIFENIKRKVERRGRGRAAGGPTEEQDFDDGYGDYVPF